MCPCSAHWDSSKPCTCSCNVPGHANYSIAKAMKGATTRMSPGDYTEWRNMLFLVPELDNFNTHTARPESD
jgi:hypothetical protein